MFVIPALQVTYWAVENYLRCFFAAVNVKAVRFYKTTLITWPMHEPENDPVTNVETYIFFPM